MYLGDATWPDAGAELADTSTALVPIGSTEQHGPHLPLSTDHVIAEGLARAAADTAGVVCTPTITIGVSPHHRQFHGTLSVDAPTFRDYIESLSRSLVYQGVDRIIYVNAHGGNVEHLREVGRRLHDDDAAYAVEWMYLITEKIFKTLWYQPFYCNESKLPDGRGKNIQRKEEKVGRACRGKSPAESVSASTSCYRTTNCSGKSARAA
jgi:creatinine amidohydrolase